MIRFARAVPWVGALGVLCAANVHADTLYTLFNNVGQTPSGFIQVGLTSHREATDFFTNGAAVTITGATLRLNNQDSVDHTVTASLWSGESAPLTLVGSFDPITVPSNFTFANFSFSSAGIGLAANSAYWVVLQIHEDITSDAVGWQITFSEDTDAGSVFSAIADTASTAAHRGTTTLPALAIFSSP